MTPPELKHVARQNNTQATAVAIYAETNRGLTSTCGIDAARAYLRGRGRKRRATLSATLNHNESRCATTSLHVIIGGVSPASEPSTARSKRARCSIRPLPLITTSATATGGSLRCRAPRTRRERHRAG